MEMIQDCTIAKKFKTVLECRHKSSSFRFGFSCIYDYVWQRFKLRSRLRFEAFKAAFTLAFWIFWISTLVRRKQFNLRLSFLMLISTWTPVDTNPSGQFDCHDWSQIILQNRSNTRLYLTPECVPFYNAVML